MTQSLEGENISSLGKLDGFRVEIKSDEARGDIILDRPPLNIIRMPQRNQMSAAFEALDNDDRVRVIVLRGNGDNFSSGGEIKGFLEHSPEHVSRLAENVMSAERSRKPVIAAIQGYCFGVGFEFCLACDFRIVTETAFVGLPEQRIGMIPGSYTITSQLVVTGVFAISIFILTLFIGFVKHGFHFLSILVPPGVPKIMIPIMIPIEIISMIARPVSLSVRLFANMTAGHTILYVLFGLAMSTPLIIGWLPFGFTVAINGLEIAIAFIQAYIFTILTCVYIGDVIHLH